MCLHFERIAVLIEMHSGFLNCFFKCHIDSFLVKISVNSCVSVAQQVSAFGC